MPVSKFLTVSFAADGTDLRLNFHHDQISARERAQRIFSDLGRNILIASASARMVIPDDESHGQPAAAPVASETLAALVMPFLVVSCKRDSSDVQVKGFPDSDAALSCIQEEGARPGRFAWSGPRLDIMIQPAVSPRSRNIHVSIDYDETPGSYRGVTAKLGDEEYRFASGDPEQDWARFLAWNECHPERCIVTSSVQHFVMDEPGWRMSFDDFGREALIREDRPEFRIDILVRELRQHFGSALEDDGLSQNVALVMAELDDHKGQILLGELVHISAGKEELGRRYQRCIYQDGQEEGWDMFGAGALDRAEEFAAAQRCAQGEDVTFIWTQVAPGELEERLSSAGAAALDQDLCLELRKHMPVFNQHLEMDTLSYV